MEKVVNYCKKVVETVTLPDYGKVEFEKKGYAWNFPTIRPIIGKKPDEKLLAPVPLTHIGVRTP